MIGLEEQLSDALGKPVDLLTEAAISPYLRGQYSEVPWRSIARMRDPWYIVTLALISIKSG
jgi:uncharacterized protein with HEPN domain